MKRFFALALSFLLLISFFSCTQEEIREPDYYVTVNGVRFDIGAKTDDLLASFGTPLATRESPSCAMVGATDVIYTYSGFELETYKKDGAEYLYAVFFLDDSVETPEGIRIGSSAEEVISAYGTPPEEYANGYSYERNGRVLTFFLNEEKIVSKIHYLQK